MKLHTIAFILLIVGGVNWGLYGLGYFFGGNWNIVNLLLGQWSVIEAVVYVLVGAAAVYEVATHKSNCKNCVAGSPTV